MRTGLDHIILGTNDLDRGIAWVEQRTGVRAAFGGVHLGRGTRNALLSLGADSYLEIIAPDPQQTSPTWFSQILAMPEPRLMTWAVHTSDLTALAQADAMVYFQANKDVTNDIWAESKIGLVHAFKHRLVGDSADTYKVQFSLALNALVKGRQ